MKNPHDSGAHTLVDAHAKDAAERLGALGDIERRLIVDELNAQARAMRRLDYEKDRQLAEQAFELASQTDEFGEQYTFGMATALSLLAHRNCILGEYDAALSEAAQALALLGPATPSVVLGDIYDAIGWTHFCLGDYAESLDYLMKALRVSDEIGDRSLKAYVLDSIANVHSASQEPEIALETQERALAIHRELGDAMGEALVLNNMAYTRMYLGDYERALEDARTALCYAESEGRHHLRMWVLDTLADIYLSMGDADTAEDHANHVLALAREYGSETDEANAMMALGRIALMRKDWDAALSATDKALLLSERRRLSVRVYECHALLSEIEQGRGDLETALEHYKQFHELKQAKVNEETESRLANLKVTHQVETARKDAEILRLRSLALEREVEDRRLAQARLEAQASLDPLTGLFNRGHLAVLAQELRLGLDEHRPVSLIMFDIDEFKNVNDTFGHLAGDSVLVSIARELSANARDSDTPCRYGGDEFLVMLIGIDEEGAVNAAERLRELVSSAPMRYGDAEINVTISAGVASADWNTPTDLETLVGRADRALYAAKQGGRDRVVSRRHRGIAPAAPSGEGPVA